VLERREEPPDSAVDLDIECRPQKTAAAHMKPAPGQLQPVAGSPLEAFDLEAHGKHHRKTYPAG
jgi:hypothetical protein